MSNAELVDSFLNGHCASFAIAAAKALQAAGHTGVGITILIDEDGEPNSNDERCIAHAYASSDSTDVDAGGIRTPNEMAHEYGITAYDIDGPFSENEFREFFCSEECLVLNDDWLEKAAQMISNDPSFIPSPE